MGKGELHYSIVLFSPAQTPMTIALKKKKKKIDQKNTLEGGGRGENRESS